MSEPIAMPPGLLRRLHHLHQRVGDLQGQLDRGPKQIAAAQAIVDKSQAAAEEAATRVRETTRTADQKQGQLKSREDGIAALRGKLNTAASNKEYSLLEDQIAADERANEVLSDEILEVLEKIDTLTERSAAAERKVAEDREAKDQREAGVRERLAVVEDDLKGIRASLVEEEAKLPGSIRPIYDRLVAALGADAMADGDGGSCGGCHQTLRPMVVDQLKLHRAVQCQGCQSLLYLD